MPQSAWPDLDAMDLQPTAEALHLWSQVVGKVRLMKTPWVNHSWHVPLYVSARGLATGLVADGPRGLEIEFDFLAEVVAIRTSHDQERRIPLRPQSVAEFYAAVLKALAELGVDVRIDDTPCEIADAVPFPRDQAIRAYDGDVARAYWRALLQVHRVLQLFRTRFVGKCSPIHLFWGSFDLAVTRFSGREAPPHPGGMPHMPDAVARDGYFQEVSSAGFWPGGDNGRGPSFYSYAYPAPPGFSQASVQPSAAGFDDGLGAFLLPYAAVRDSADPDQALLSFLQSTYEAAANLAGWNRSTVERAQGRIGRPPSGV